jgi:phosphoribosylformylglycinamidine cyclo-ligase
MGSISYRGIGGLRGMRVPSAAAGEGGLSYKDAGVDIDAGNELVRRIKKMNPSIGGFSGMVPFGGPPFS